MKTTRESNFELMRIVSMIFIVIWHIIVHGKVINNTIGFTNIIINLIKFIIIVHVNSFVLISGYYQSNSKFKLKKIINLMLEVIFYNIIIYCTLRVFNIIEPTGFNDYRNLFIFNFSSHWFIRTYIILYLISPFLNKLIHILTKKEYKQLLIILTFIAILIPLFSVGLLFENSGFTLLNFIYLYFIGAYIYKYKVELKFNKEKLKTIYLFIFMMCSIINLAFYYFLFFINNESPQSIQFVFSYLLNASTFYSNPLVIIQTIAFFMFFKNLKIKNKVINIISSCTLGVYIIHENIFIREHIYRLLNISTIFYRNSLFYALSSIFFGTIIIFCGCTLIDLVRKQICKLIYKIKSVQNIENKFYNFINNLFEIKE